MSPEVEDLILQMGQQVEWRKDFAKVGSIAHASGLPGQAASRLIPDQAPGHAHAAHKHIRRRKPFVPTTFFLVPLDVTSLQGCNGVQDISHISPLFTPRHKEVAGQRQAVAYG